jgi:hypothetical protein
MTLRPLVIAAIVAATGLGACGKLGALERPGPRGGVAKSDADAGPDPSHSIRTVDPRNRNSDNVPVRTDPIDDNNPVGLAPPHVLPDPFANPK